MLRSQSFDGPIDLLEFSLRVNPARGFNSGVGLPFASAAHTIGNCRSLADAAQANSHWATSDKNWSACPDSVKERFQSNTSLSSSPLALKLVSMQRKPGSYCYSWAFKAHICEIEKCTPRSKMRCALA